MTDEDLKALFEAFKAEDDYLQETHLRAKRYWHERIFPPDPRAWLAKAEREFEAKIPLLPQELQGKFQRYAEDQLRSGRRCIQVADTEGLAMYLMMLDVNIDAVRQNINLEMAYAYSDVQSGKGSAGAAARWGDRHHQNKVIEILSEKKDELGDLLPNVDLWSELYGMLDGEGLSPLDTSGERPKDTDRICWEGNPEGLTYKTFRNRVGKFRGE